MRRLKAAVIGLGNIGFKFNLDPLRKITWSHVAAYERCRLTELVGALEINRERSRLFKRCYKHIPVFRTVKELMDNAHVDIVSICTPTATHYRVLKDLARYSIRAIFCEKPIATTLKDAEKMVSLCKRKGIVLAVNHIRRWDNNYLSAKRFVENGQVGDIKTVTASYSGQVFNIGTHLFDTIRMLISKDAKVVSSFFSSKVDSDPNISGWVKFEGDLPCTVAVTGKRRDLVFDIDVIGDKGRIRITENGERIERFSFAKSKRYSGYRELSPMPTRPVVRRDRFVEAIRDIVMVIDGRKENVNCLGADGLAALSLSLAMVKSAKKDGKPVKVEGFKGA